MSENHKQENQTFDEIEILHHRISVHVLENTYQFQVYWKDTEILNQNYHDLYDGLTELQNAFFGLEFDVYDHIMRETARKEFFRVLRTRWRWLHN